MIQILVALFGVIALLKGEMKVTQTRILSTGRARMLGLALLLLAAAPLLPFWPRAELVQMLGLPVGTLFLVLVAFAMSKRGAVDRAPGFRSPEAPEPSAGRQLVGETCVGCKGMVVTADQATHCRACGSVVHSACLKAHRREMHRSKSTAAASSAA